MEMEGKRRAHTLSFLGGGAAFPVCASAGLRALPRLISSAACIGAAELPAYTSAPTETQQCPGDTTRSLPEPWTLNSEELQDSQSLIWRCRREAVWTRWRRRCLACALRVCWAPGLAWLLFHAMRRRERWRVLVFFLPCADLRERANHETSVQQSSPAAPRGDRTLPLRSPLCSLRVRWT